MQYAPVRQNSNRLIRRIKLKEHQQQMLRAEV